MAARAHKESASRVSDCVTALLRDQPFFGSLALRLPIRPDAARETLASDGREIRYSPEWVAQHRRGSHQDRDRPRGAGLCAQAPHAPGRARARALAAGLAARHPRAACATRASSSRPDAESWDGISVEQAYDRLPVPQAGRRGRDRQPAIGRRRRRRGRSATRCRR